MTHLLDKNLPDPSWTTQQATPFDDARGTLVQIQRSPRHRGAHRKHVNWQMGPIRSDLGLAGLLLAAALAVLMPTVTVLDVQFPGRTLLALGYVLLLPGVPLVRSLGLPSRLAGACLVLALSLAVQILVCIALLNLNLFGGLQLQLLVSSITLIATPFALRSRSAERTGIGDFPAPSEWFPLAVAGLRSARVTAMGLSATLLLWAVGLATADPTAMNKFGFISIVGFVLPIGVIVLAVTAVNELRRPTLRVFWLSAIVVAFFVILQGSMSVVEPVASLPVGRVHLAFAEYIKDHGAVLKGFDARFSWPGFFALLASVTTAAGLPDGGDLLRWAPLAQNLMMLLPLILLARSLSTSRRMIWLAAILYACGNWFQQDYLSPQALALFLMFVILALLLWSTKPLAADAHPSHARRWAFLPDYVRRPRSKRPERIEGLDRSRSLWLFGCILLVLAATIVSHQLTPVALVLDLLILAFVRRTRFPGLWVIVAVMTMAWISYAATDFWLGHINDMFGGIGDLSATLNNGISDRILGTSQHQSMLYLRIAFSAAFLLMALIGLFLIRRTSNAMLMTGLAFAPFGLLAWQSYGGEIFLRCFIFALPILAIAAAEAFGPWLSGRSLAGATLAAAALFVLSIGLIAVRGANAGFERITTSQLDAVTAIEAATGPGDDITRVASLNEFTALGGLPMDRFRTPTFGPTECGGLAATPACIVHAEPDFLYISSSQQAYGEVAEGRPSGWAMQIESDVLASGDFTVFYQADDVVVLKRIGSRG